MRRIDRPLAVRLTLLAVLIGVATGLAVIIDIPSIDQLRRSTAEPACSVR